MDDLQSVGMLDQVPESAAVLVGSSAEGGDDADDLAIVELETGPVLRLVRAISADGVEVAQKL
jgi:hypothetical protein